jgi:hypothetical protein
VLPLQAFLRAGCVHITFDAVQPAQPQQRITWRQVAEALGPALLHNRPVLLQQGTQACILADGRQVADWEVGKPGGPAQLTAGLLRVEPCVVVAGRAAELRVTCTSGGPSPEQAVKLHVRYQGRYVEHSTELLEEQHGALEAAEAQAGAGGAAGAMSQAAVQSLRVRLPAMSSPGLLQLEQEEGLLISEALPVLVVPDEALAQELQALVEQLPTEQMTKVRGRRRRLRPGHACVCCGVPACTGSRPPPPWSGRCHTAQCI